ncbi:hypothetical protein DH2020_026819 [Rehmannia glutinosa]|uniref:Uncharacterized protein n=1 Tax=Rehmannia glutinosa TaxID=99300 RepID=A0ABR0VVU2_REHGL
MQCPNCRKIEKGQWLYANGSRPLPEFSMDDWAHDEDPVSVGTDQKFNYEGSTQMQKMSSTSHHDPLGHHPIFAEHTPVSSTSHPCPYIAYVGTFHPSSSTSSRNVSDVSSFNNQWSGLSVPSEVPTSYAFPSMDVHYHSWDHSSPFPASSRIGSADQPSIHSVTQRTARNTSDIPRPGMHPFIVGHSSGSRAPSSVTSYMIPPYPAHVARPRDRQSYFQQDTNIPIARTSHHISAGWRSSSHRGLTQVAPIPSSSSDQSNGFYLVSSARNFQEAENPYHDHFHAWEREHQPAFPLGQLDRDSTLTPSHPPASGSGNFRQRHQNRS